MKEFLLAIRSRILLYFRYTYPYIILSLIILIPAFIYEPIFGGIALLVLAFLATRDVTEHDKRLEIKSKEEKREQEEFSSVTQHAIFHMPYPMVTTDENGVITWQNSHFTEIIGQVARNTKISEAIPALTLNAIDKGDSFIFSYKDKIYEANLDKVLEGGAISRYIIYMYDITDNKNLEKAHYNDALVAMFLFVDNLDEVKSSGDEAFRTQIQSRIDTVISNYFTSLGCFVRKYEQDKYVILSNRESFNKIKTRKFDILDEVRDIELGDTIPVTLSIGVSDVGENPLEKYQKARSTMDVALGRGGDQAVCVTDNGYEYFGGKTKAVQKRTKVKARVIGYALKELIKEADNIYISGHKNPDMDAIGSAVGMMAAVQLMEKRASLILGDDTFAVKNIINMMKEESPDIYKSIIKPEDALKAFKSGDLLILTDHHKPSLSPSEELSKVADNIVVIDHHRRAEEFVQNPALVYLEPHASSASELVAEILQYMVEDKKLSHFESSALLSGIMLDTKNFTTQTGIRTFEAAGLLVRMGADPEEVKLLFRDEFDTFINRARATQTTEIYKEKFAIADVEKGDSAILTAAQVSDELLQVEGVEASFCLADLGDSTHVSARSNGKISVQLIMEALGGGGHIAQAGARLDKDVEETKLMLKEAILKYLKEDEK